MNSKVIAGVGALALCGAMSSGIAQTATESRQTTVEESKSVVQVPKARADVREETTTTTTKKGLLGRKKETTNSTTRYEGSPDPANNAEVRSRTTVETERRSRE